MQLNICICYITQAVHALSVKMTSLAGTACALTDSICTVAELMEQAGKAFTEFHLDWPKVLRCCETVSQQRKLKSAGYSQSIGKQKMPESSTERNT